MFFWRRKNGADDVAPAALPAPERLEPSSGVCPLSTAPQGCPLKIIAIGPCDCASRLAELGMLPDRVIKVVSAHQGNTNLIIDVSGTRFGINPKLGELIQVRPIKVDEIEREQNSTTT